MARFGPSPLTGGFKGSWGGESPPKGLPPLGAWCWGGGGIVTIPGEEAELKSGCGDVIKLLVEVEPADVVLNKGAAPMNGDPPPDDCCCINGIG